MNTRETVLLAAWGAMTALGMLSLVPGSSRGQPSRGARKQTCGYLLLGLMVPLGLFGRASAIPIGFLSAAIIAVSVLGLACIVAGDRILRGRSADGDAVAHGDTDSGPKPPEDGSARTASPGR